MISALPARLLVALLPMAPETVENETLKFLALVSNDWKIGFLFCDWLRLTGVCAPYIGFDSAIFHFNYSDLIGFSNILIFRIKFSKFMRLSKFGKKKHIRRHQPVRRATEVHWPDLRKKITIECMNAADSLWIKALARTANAAISIYNPWWW